jgi:hypothetical protein
MGKMLHYIVSPTVRCMPTQSDHDGDRENMDSASLTICRRHPMPLVLSLRRSVPFATPTMVSRLFPLDFTQRVHNNLLTGGFYDFTSDLSSKDTAYTSESLEPHTDTTYFTDPIVSAPSYTTVRPHATATNNTMFRESKRFICSLIRTEKEAYRLWSTVSVLPRSSTIPIQGRTLRSADTASMRTQVEMRVSASSLCSPIQC